MANDELDHLFQKADEWPSTFNLASLGGYIVRHPELLGKSDTATQRREAADREHRDRTRLVNS